MVNALNVGNSVLQRAFSEDIDVTPMKLQKLIYFIYHDYLCQTGMPLFNERFETWRYGPVVPSVYNKFKKYGSNAIRYYGTEDDGKTVLSVNEDSSIYFKNAIDYIWNTCKSYDGIYLSSLTHRDGSAWSKAFEKGSPCLSDDDIKAEVVSFG